MRRPIQFFLRYPVVTVMVALLAVVAGLEALLHMPRMEDPSITIRTGLVLAAYPGATAEQVEQQVTRPLEAHLFRFPEVRKDKTFATSRPGLVIFNVELEDQVRDPDVVWSKVRAELELAKATELPQEIQGPVVDSDFGDTVAMLIAVRGERFGYRELKDAADQVKDELRSIRDVGRLVTYGTQEEQIWITGDLGRWAQYPGDPARILGALGQRNGVGPSGNVDAGATRVPVRTQALFTSEDQIRQTIVDVSPSGQPVHLGDLAKVERRYGDPDHLVRYDGQPCLLIAVEMQKGKNIVEMGDKVAAALARVRRRIPADLKLDVLADQPAVVASRMHHLGVEFLLAMGAVILVALVLLPMRVALIAALAIPITMLGTLGLLDALGIQLHQVSIAALIVVLGIVVDDAIVIADNYLELLDHGVPRGRAAWRSAAEVVVPVLTATLTIIASFLPLLILEGSVGEFISALPLTVALALSVSFLVAIFITPWLCRRFIAHGLKADPAAPAGRNFRVLDWVQGHYGSVITWLMGHKVLALAAGGLSVALGALMYAGIPQQFFPSAERNQFVIDLWMPEGTRIQATQAALERIEGHLRNLSEVAHVATFVGESAPRFYYNVNPQQPDAAYGQLVVNTRDLATTPALVARLQTDLAKVVPEGLVIAKELQQGDTLEAPVEVRLSGESASALKVAGRQVEDLLRALPGTLFVHTDHFNAALQAEVNVDPESANRLGLTHLGIARTLAGGLDGMPVTFFREGDRTLPVLLRLDPAHRGSFGAVRGTPLLSAATQGNLPLGAVATLTPQWQPSRLVRRNGVPTLTVRSFVQPGVYASTIQAQVERQLAAHPLPEGVRVAFGGESENQDGTFPGMLLALGISLAAIFLVLLLQFRNLKEPLVIMASIPLSVFGAMLGLVVTGNPFGFTAFMGMISLCGIVVRNAIILVDALHARLRDGVPMEEAAKEAGARRLRPIFLTTLAAAVGVLPMILSGSKLWSPLASVIAVGLVLSMLSTLLVIPVLYVVVLRPRRPRAWKAVLALLALGGAASAGRAGEPLDLEACTRRALQANLAVRIARAKVEALRHGVGTAQADYLPQLTASLDWSRSTTQGLVTLPAGCLGTLPGGDLLPAQPLSLDQGSRNLALGNLTLGQPLTPLLKVRQGEVAARKDLESAEAERSGAEAEVRLGVHQAFVGFLVARQQQEVARAELAVAETAQEDGRAAVKAGQALRVADLGAGAAVLRARQNLLTARHQEEDARRELGDLLQAGPEESLDFSMAEPPPPEPPSLDGLREAALQHNAGLRAARAQHGKSQAGVVAARLAYVPDVNAYVRYTNQSGVPFLRSDFVTVGLQFSWSLFDGGRRSHTLSQRSAESLQAQENVQRLEQRVRLDVEKGCRRFEEARALLDAAEQAARYQAETLRIARDQRQAGLIPPVRLGEAMLADARARLDALQARLGVGLAVAELERLRGE
jgi:multidrug efflux pump subunit AcrB/outer membrane protein TolC